MLPNEDLLRPSILLLQAASSPLCCSRYFQYLCAARACGRRFRCGLDGLATAFIWEHPLMSRVRVCTVQDLGPQEVCTASLKKDRFGYPRQALVVRDARGRAHAYLNECRHLPVPIDAGSGEFFDGSGQHLMCGTHGAEYRIEDGYCFAGPCAGMSLERLELVEEGGVFYVLDP